MSDLDTMPVECPSCGRISRIDPTARSRDEFCRSCDYPLFWAVDTPREATLELGEGRRRLPGMTGLRTVGSLRCPSCTEPNPASAERCVRCGSELNPEPVMNEPTVVIEPELVEPEWSRPPIGSMTWVYLVFVLVPLAFLLVMLAIVG